VRDAPHTPSLVTEPNLPPEAIDGASVLLVADVRGLPAIGTTRHVVDGVHRDDFAYLVVAAYLDGEGAYLFRCDSDWRALTDTLHPGVQEALEQAAFEYGGVRFAARGSFAATTAGVPTGEADAATGSGPEAGRGDR
jgi:hypothetical protein